MSLQALNQESTENASHLCDGQLYNLSDVVSMLGGRLTLEEGDQLVILNAFDVNCKDRSVKLDIFSVDTDVFIMLTGCYPLIPHRITPMRRQGERLSI